MTVKVISGPEVYTATETCTGCKATLEATEPDFKVGCFGANYGGDTGEDGLYFDCPVCDSAVRLKKAPSALLYRVKRRTQPPGGYVDGR